MQISIFVWSIIGLVASLYAVYVHNETDASFVPICDVNQKIRCSTTLRSEYANLIRYSLKHYKIYEIPEHSLLDRSNGELGVVFYLFALLYSLGLNKVISKELFLLSTIVSTAVTGLLGYFMLYVLKEYCLVCLTTYVATVSLFLISVNNLAPIPQTNKTKNKKEE